MKIDLTYQLSKEKIEEWLANLTDRNKNVMALGHIGTHFDAMNKIFPLEYGESRGIIFDVHDISDREVDAADIDVEAIRAGDFVLLYTGAIEKFAYGSGDYFKNNPVLSWKLIEALVDKKIRIIGVDSCGIRRGEEHAKADKFCADNDTFVIENLVNLEKLIGAEILIHTYPLNLTGFSGIPARVIAEIL